MRRETEEQRGQSEGEAEEQDSDEAPDARGCGQDNFTIRARPRGDGLPAWAYGKGWIWTDFAFAWVRHALPFYTLQGRRPAAVFHPFGHPIAYAYASQSTAATTSPRRKMRTKKGDEEHNRMHMAKGEAQKCIWHRVDADCI
jgi:hypothetical protein